MSLLYPRLDRLLGAVTVREHRNKTLRDLEKAAEVEDPTAVFAATGGAVVSPGYLAELVHGVRALAIDLSYPNPASDAVRVTFDRRLGVHLHDTMDISPAEAAAREVWTFLAVRALPDIVAWRFGFDNEERWLGSDLTRHALGRLWWQAHTLGVSDGDTWRYDLVDVLSESELNQIFERRSIGGNPTLVRSIARAVQQVPPPTGVSRRFVIRDVTKRIRRLLPFTSFQSLPDHILDARICGLLHVSGEALARESGSG
jgi:Family of unknown function (DUF6339)